MPCPPDHLAIICTTEPLPRRAGLPGDQAELALTISAAIVSAGLTDAQVGDLAAYLRPWAWDVTGARLLRWDSTDGAGAMRASADCTVIPAPDPANGQAYTTLVDRMESRWAQRAQAADRSIFVWNHAPFVEDVVDDSGRETDNGAPPLRRPWYIELANASAFPYPLGQWLRLSWVVRVPQDAIPATGMVAIAPELRLRRTPGEPGFACTLAVAADGASTAEWVPDRQSACWPYDAPGAPVSVVAHLGPVVPSAPASWIPLAAGNVHGSDWRARLVHDAAEAIDIPQRLLDGALTTIGPNGLPDAVGRVLVEHLSRFRDIVIAAMHDSAGLGNRPTPSDLTLIEEWEERWIESPDVSTSLQAERRRWLVDKKLDPANLVGAQFSIGLDRWKELLREALEEHRGAEALRPAAAVGTSKLDLPGAIGELQEIRNALLIHQNIAQLAFLQLLLLYSGLAEDPHFLAFREFVTRTMLGDPAGGRAASAPSDRMARQLMAAGVLGKAGGIASGSRPASLWEAWITPPAGTIPSVEILLQRLPALATTYFLRRFGDLTNVPGVVIAADALADLRLAGDPDIKGLTDTLVGLIQGATSIQAKQLVPTQGGDAPRPPGAPRRPATPVPHPLVVQVMQPVATPAAGSDADRDDKLRQSSGFGLLLRERNQEWACLNLGSPADVAPSFNGRMGTASRWDDTLRVVVPLRLGYRDGLAESVISYENRPLAAMGPEALMADHALVGPEDRADPDDRPPFGYLYVDPKLAWGRAPGLVFGRTYELASFAIGNSGALPAALASADHPSKLRDTPAAIDPPPSAAIVPVRYRRRVAVGAVRFSSGVEAKCDDRLALPAVPEGVFLRVRDRIPPADGTTAPEALPAPAEPVLLLAESQSELRPEYRDRFGKPFNFAVRPPATDLQTWLRWSTNDTTAEKRQAVVEDYYKRLRDNHQNRDVGQSACMTLDDPAVAGLAVRVERVVGDSVKLVNVVQLTASGDPAAGVAGATSSAIPVTVTVGTAEVVDPRNGKLDITVLPGALYRVTFFSLVETQKFKDRFDDGFDVGNTLGLLESPLDSTHTAFSPFTLNVEVVPAMGANKLIQPKALWDGMTVHFGSMPKVALKNAGILKDAHAESPTDDHSHWLGISLALKYDDHPLVHQVELLHQTWRWRGRPVFPDDVPSWSAAAADQWLPASDQVIKWEVQEFGDRDDGNHLIEPMQTMIRRSGKVLERYCEYGLNLETDRRASYHRVRVKAYNRYAAIMEGTDVGVQVTSSLPLGGKEQRNWRSFLVPSRVVEPLPEPLIRMVLPLTDTAEIEESLGEKDRLRELFPGNQIPVPDRPAPRLLVVVGGEAFGTAGLAERFNVQLSVANGQHEIAPDPIVSADPGPGNLKDPTLAHLGPVGHTRTPAGEYARYTTASYLVSAPPAVSPASWPMMRVRFARSIDPRQSRGATPPLVWTKPQWMQVVPDISIYGSDVLSSGRTSLETQGKELVLLVDGKPVTLQPTSADFALFLLVTRRVGRMWSDSDEAFFGIFAQNGNRWASLKGVPDEPLANQPGLTARVMEVQMGTRFGAQPPTSMEEFWDRLFDPRTSKRPNGRTDKEERERIRITRLSRAVRTPSPLAAVLAAPRQVPQPR